MSELYSTHSASTSYITQTIPGVGGELRCCPEDFLVEEVPQYEPTGQGEHRYLFIEKRGLPTLEATAIIARHMGVRRRDVGYAGLKDKHAVTRQWISIYDTHAKHPEISDLADARITILNDSRHNNKLRRGHLKANRFMITIRNHTGTYQQAFDSLALLARHGVPNRAGVQRFGLRGNNHMLGRLLILGRVEAFVQELLAPDDPTRADHKARQFFEQGQFQSAINAFPRSARSECLVLKALLDGLEGPEILKRIDQNQRMFWITAFQSAVFNQVLDHRLESGTLAKLELGDVASVLRDGKAGACFVVDQDTVQADETQERLDRFELSPAGPLWGHEMLRAQGATDALEIEALEALDVSVDDVMSFASGASEREMRGDRRAMRIPVGDVDVQEGADDTGAFINCRFTLPPGAFATVVMDEVMKPGSNHA
jgi:tRNA pseudouridine13 synthase